MKVIKRVILSPFILIVLILVSVVFALGLFIDIMGTGKVPTTVTVE